eukprot:5156-Heterococcus_DN1.PRE.3
MDVDATQGEHTLHTATHLISTPLLNWQHSAATSSCDDAMLQLALACSAAAAAAPAAAASSSSSSSKGGKSIRRASSISTAVGHSVDGASRSRTIHTQWHIYLHKHTHTTALSARCMLGVMYASLDRLPDIDDDTTAGNIKRRISRTPSQYLEEGASSSKNQCRAAERQHVVLAVLSEHSL